MKEIGYEMPGQVRKQLRPDMLNGVDIVISIVGKEDLPEYATGIPILRCWRVADPHGMSIEGTRGVRDKIRAFVEDLVKELAEP